MERTVNESAANPEDTQETFDTTDTTADKIDPANVADGQGGDPSSETDGVTTTTGARDSAAAELEDPDHGLIGEPSQAANDIGGHKPGETGSDYKHEAEKGSEQG